MMIPRRKRTRRKVLLKVLLKLGVETGVEVVTLLQRQSQLKLLFPLHPTTGIPTRIPLGKWSIG